MGRKKLINYAAIAVVLVVYYFSQNGGLNLGGLTGNKTAPGHSSGAASKADFDHYVLALSWSPSFCASDGKKNKEQCGSDRDYAFVVHGLWPQYDRGGWPADCAGKDAPRVPNNVVDDIRGIMPSKGLIIHEWRKHGTCSGQDPAGYFDTTRAAFKKVSIPKEFQALDKPLKVTAGDVKKAFVSANSGLSDKAVVVTCDNRLREVRVCMDKSLNFRDCGKSTGRTCKAGRDIVMLPSR